MSGRELFPLELYDLGYRDLISIIPPHATLTPGSKISASSLGKVPGRRSANGTWGGYPWRTHQATRDEVAAWLQDGANIGMRAGKLPGLDADSLNETVANQIEWLAMATLGSAPVRIGRAPKRLLMYKTAKPFGRMRLWLEKDGESHLIELLGDGQQYLVHGMHPITLRPYEWLPLRYAVLGDGFVPAENLSAINAGLVNELFTHMEHVFTAQGFIVRREGDGKKQERTATTDQGELRAPSIEALREAVAFIPNDDKFRDRDTWIKFGAAIRAAAGDDAEEGYQIFAEFSGRWEQGQNDGDYIRTNWRRLYAPFSVGWGWIAALARGFGYRDAAEEFPTEGTAPEEREVGFADRLSERALAIEVVRRVSDRLRFVPPTNQWLVWDGHRWQRDAMLAAQNVISGALREIAKGVAKGSEIRRIESSRTLFDVMKLVKADRTIAVDPTALDSDPWLLNTPVGVVDLRTGLIRPPRPEELHTKSTKVGPDFSMPTQEWDRYFAEATAGDRELQMYLLRFAGYCLTGITREHIFVFIYGPGGCGKGRFQITLMEILCDYAVVAAMDTFTASKYGDRHSTDLARLMGARLVIASETQKGKRWDEQRVKSLTGGDPVTARLMRQDNMTFVPPFKLLFIGNHQPHVQDLDAAMKRRMHVVPFITPPKVTDQQLAEKLRREYPGILAKYITGCLEWQVAGLQPSAAVLATTEDYFESEDDVGRWLEECCETDPTAETRSTVLFESWRQWCGETAAYVGSQKGLTQSLKARGFESFRGRGNGNQFAHFKGLSVRPDFPAAVK